MASEKYIKNYTNGTLSPALSGDYLETHNPATGKAYAQFAASDESDVLQAIEGAQRAYAEWSKTDLRRRFRILTRIADIIEQEAAKFAKAETIDTGKPFSMSQSFDIPWAQSNFRFFASSILHTQSNAYHQGREAVHFTKRQPLGVVACFGNYGMPLYSLTRRIAPALAAGNCVIAKPAEQTPAAAHLLAKACLEAKLPPGVLNIIQGKDSKIRPALLEHKAVRAIAYDGSTAIGKEIIRTIAPQFKKLRLDLGSKNANIIFGDCDFNQMMVHTLRSSFSNNGQLNTCCPRILVERSFYEKFKEELVKRTSFLKVGDPFSSVTDLGALISQQQLEKVQSYISLVEVEGGNLLCGGKLIEMEGDLEKGFFIRPAVVEGLSNDARVNQEEILGPIVTLQPFDTEEEAVALANATDYGLAASVWTANSTKAHRVAEQLRVGTVWINGWNERNLQVVTTGVRQSGLGTEGGMASLDFFTEGKTICVKY